MSDNRVLTAIDQRGVATVTLNRPEKHNAFDEHMIVSLTQAFESIAASKDVRVMVLAANGKSFCAGADLGWMRRMASHSYEGNLHDAEQLSCMLKTLYELPVPTIARVQGAALGGAVGLVSCCDMAVATAKASFALSGVKIGLVPATIAPYVVRAIGKRACRRYFLTAERFDAITAKELQLLSMVVEEAELNGAIDQLCTCVLANGPLAVATGKQLVFDVTDQLISDELIQKTSELIARIRVSEEGQEGLNAFLEKRPANWVKES